MARSRLIKPALAKNEVLAELGPMAQLLFAMLSCFADREGRLEDRPRRLKVEIFPYYEVDVDDLSEQLATCEENFISRYEVGGKRYIQITNFAVHQSPHCKETASTLPAQFEHEPSMNQARGKQANPGVHAPNKDKDKNEDRNEQAKIVLPDEVATAELLEAVRNWLAYKKERKESYKQTGLNQFMDRINTMAKSKGSSHVADLLQKAMSSGWKGWEHESGNSNKKTISRIGPGQKFDPTVASTEKPRTGF